MALITYIYRAYFSLQQEKRIKKRQKESSFCLFLLQFQKLVISSLSFSVRNPQSQVAHFQEEAACMVLELRCQWQGPRCWLSNPNPVNWDLDVVLCQTQKDISV